VVLPTGPIDLAATLDGGQAFRWWAEGDGHRGVIGDRVVRISPARGGVLIEALDDRPAGGLAEAAADYLSISQDLDELRRCFADDPCLGPATAGYGGLRVLRQDPWECLVSFICSSTSNIPRIKLNVGSVAALGPRIGPGARDYGFPSPEVVAAAGEMQLRELGLGFRAKFVIPAAEAAASGRLNLAALRTAPYPEAREALMALPGVGEKVADCVLAFSLDKPESFPVDRHIRRALEKWYSMPGNLNNSKASDWARAKFGRHGALANQYMFHRERLASRAAAWGGAHVSRALAEDVGPRKPS
jgi:N-glycosylase/DNA lyase